jgi:ubiquinone/menaquinone biosynthesis C-methylase UbiE
MDSYYEEWDKIYRRYPLETLPWELGKPRKVLVELVEKGLIKKGKALDLCCGAGTNALYLTKKGFQVTGIDISSKAIEYAKEKAKKANVRIQFQVQNFLNLSFKDEEFDFIFDMGCFHHVKVKDRSTFIRGVHRILKKNGSYLMICFSDGNGPAWNHFTKEQIIQLFSEHFKIKSIEHVASVEGDGYTRYFYSVLMEKR